MPSWSPPPDLRFDHAAARDAAEALGRARRAVMSVGDAEAAALTPARRRWRGRARDGAEDVLGPHGPALIDALEQLQALERELETAMDRAQVEQQRRDALQRLWRSEADLAALGR